MICPYNDEKAPVTIKLNGIDYNGFMKKNKIIAKCKVLGDREDIIQCQEEYLWSKCETYKKQALMDTAEEFLNLYSGLLASYSKISHLTPIEKLNKCIELGHEFLEMLDKNYVEGYEFKCLEDIFDCAYVMRELIKFNEIPDGFELKNCLACPFSGLDNCQLNNDVKMLAESDYSRPNNCPLDDSDE